MSHYRLLIAAARVLAVLVAVGLFIKVGPTIPQATGHTATTTQHVRAH